MFSFRWTRFLARDDDGRVPPAAYFASLPVLETDRLILRPLRRQDAKDIFSYASDPDVARFVLWDPHKTLSETKAYLRYMRSLSRRGLPSSWAVTLRDSGKVIGTMGFMWFSEANSAAEVGYSLSKAFWNQGYATEALRAVIRSVFASLSVNRLEAQHDLRNPASGRVMEKSGMKKEGILRQRIRNKGEFIDVVLYAVLRSDLENQP
jgi:ribosomal-protein-alanine N-acetyltransferase